MEVHLFKERRMIHIYGLRSAWGWWEEVVEMVGLEMKKRKINMVGGL